MESMEDYRNQIKKEAKEAFQLGDTSYFSELIGRLIRITFGDTEISARITSVKCRYKDFLPGQANAYPISGFFVTLQTDHYESTEPFRVRLFCYGANNKIFRAVQGQLVLPDIESDWHKMEAAIQILPSMTTNDEWHELSSTK